MTEGPTELELDGWTRATLHVLRTRGIPEPDLIPTARAGLVLVAVWEDTEEARAFRTWLAATSAGVLPDPTLPLTRYLRMARSHLGIIRAWWGQGEALGRPVLGALWSSLDRIEGERLLAGVGGS